MNQRIQQEIVSEDNLVYRLKRPLHKCTDPKKLDN